MELGFRRRITRFPDVRFGAQLSESGNPSSPAAETSFGVLLSCALIAEFAWVVLYVTLSG